MNFLRLLFDEISNKTRDLVQRVHDRYKYGASGSGVSLSPAGVREVLNQNQSIVIGFCGLLILIAIGYAVFGTFFSGGGDGDGPAAASTKTWYTDDDGKTLFTDKPDLTTPFPHGSGQAVRAMVFSCDGGKTRFIAYLQRDSERSRTEMARVEADPNLRKNPLARAMARNTGFEVKKPGTPDKDWVSLDKQAEFAKATKLACPDGTMNNLTPVTP